MKTKLNHLPTEKYEELSHIKKKIQQVYDTHLHMIILYGSYARGDFVVKHEYKEDHTTYSYESDFDIMVIVDTPQIASSLELFHKVNQKILKCKAITVKVQLIVEDICNVNEALSLGRYFYRDIKKEGILLYDSKTYTLAKPRKLSPEERKQMALEDYEVWMDNYSLSIETYITYRDSFKKTPANKYLKGAAFQLHQASEQLLTAVALVHTDYRPKEHSIQKLIQYCHPVDKRFQAVFPRKTEEENRLFNLLEKAYIDARYKKGYRITEAELDYLGEKVGKLESLVVLICRPKTH